MFFHPSARKASMGSSLAARMAGKITKKRPTPVATQSERITAVNGVSMGNENSAYNKNTSEYADRIPISPQEAASTADSVRNYSMMCFFLAPMERLEPISHDRSCT